MPFEWIEFARGSRDYLSMLRIRDVRKSKRVTQEELAGRIGTSQSNISEIEKGKHNPTLDTLGRIASALDVSIKELFDETSERDEIIDRFRDAYELLEPEDRLMIIELAEKLGRQNMSFKR